MMERFWDKATIKGPDDCWLWTAAVCKDGYGAFRIEGSTVRAHRMAYELEVGPIPPDKLVRHTCDTPACVNPRHLLLGTPKENRQDQVERGRSWKGSNHPMAILNEEQVLQIRQLFASGGKSISELSKLFDIKYGTMWAIVSRQRWRHI